MNSSTGFKKRSLLRPPSGMRERQRQYLKIFDISQSEPLIANQIKSQIIRIQQQINQLDKDKKIRTGQSSLQKSYISTLKKWLRQALNSQQKQDDDMKILKYMGVESYESGFRKLWKIISSFDNLITKVTELQIIQMLKYDDIFNDLSQDSQKTTQILSTLSKAGFNSGSFQVSQVMLERNKDLYSLLLQSKRKGTHNNLSSTNNSSFITNTQKQSARKSQTNQLILQLQKQNSKLSQLLEQLDRQKQNNQKLMKQLKKKEQIIKQNQNVLNNNQNTSNNSNNNIKSATSIKSSNSFGQACIDLQQRYKQRINFLNNQIHKLQTQISDLKISLSSLQSKLKMAQMQIKQHDPIKNIKVQSGTYEQALLQQMQKMKKGFQKKIQKILEDFATKEKQMRKKQIQYRNQNDKVKWEKGLLLKKFDSMQNLAK